MLVRLLYASRASAPLAESVVAGILATARRHNPAHGITGMLCHDSSQFIQVLEGARDEVSELYNRIARDPRHMQVQLLVFEEICERRFGGWTMAQLDAGKVNPALLLKYSERAELNPFGCPGHAILALLDELITTGAVANRGG